MLNVVELGLVCLCFVGLQSLPTGNKYEKQIPSDDAIKFMKKYGYLVDDNGQSEAIYSEENLSNIIKHLQRFGAIEQTGVIDNRTLKLMSSPRCGVPDILPNKDNKRKKRFVAFDGWNKRHITYYVSNWSPRLGERVVAENIQKALDMWGEYGRLTFSRSYSPDADIIVAFQRGNHGDQYPFDGPGLVLAHAFFPDGSESPSIGGDIHFDDEEEWKDLYNSNNKEAYGKDFFTVALHELGHSLGLSHSEVETSVMFPYYREWEPDSQVSLDYDDILGMYTLYIQRKLKSDDEVSPYYPNRPLPTTERPYWTTPRDREELTPTSRRLNPWFDPDQSSTEVYENRTIRYEGDDESVDDHRKHDPHNKTPKDNSPSLPYICHGHFDAVATLRDELFIFKDEYLWRLKDRGTIIPGYPTLIYQMFPELPRSIKKIDAAYQRPDGNIVLFTGDKLWIYSGTDFIANSPLPLSYYDLPDYLDSIDAVQNWAKTGKTYFYKNDRFWRYDETSKTMDPGYPMHMDRWRGVPTDLDAATTWKDGVTYFFKGELFWKFDNNWIITTETSPLPIAPIWLGCKEEILNIESIFGA